MEHILVERYFDSAQDYDSFPGLSARAPWCYEQYRLSYWGSYVSLSGDRIFCHFRAPDAESFRIPNRQHGVPFTTAWAASLQAGLASPDLEGPKGLLRLLCPTDFDRDPEAEPQPQVIVVVAGGEPVNEHPGRLLWRYRARNNDRTVSILDNASEDAVRESLPETAEVWAAKVRSRHITA
jgi:hypothetical protein